MSAVIYATASGFLTSLSLILAIGAQNAFVLRQGLLGRHVLWLCLFCSASDAILITVGVFGFGALSEHVPGLTRYLTLFGAAFLFAYGLLRLRSAWIGVYDSDYDASAGSLSRTIVLAAAFTWLNPHVYLDTVALIGAVSTGFAGFEKMVFAIGAVSASFAFFFTLGFGARLLAPIMQSRNAWRTLDVVIGIMMCWLALGLLVLK